MKGKGHKFTGFITKIAVVFETSCLCSVLFIFFKKIKKVLLLTSDMLQVTSDMLQVTSDMLQVVAWSRNSMVLSSCPLIWRNLPRLYFSVVKYTYIKWSPVEIQTLTPWMHIGHVMTACVIAQQCSSATFAYCAFISARKKRRFSKTLLFELLFLFRKTALVRECL